MSARGSMSSRNMIYSEPAYDDTVCCTCGGKLPDDPPESSWAFNGFCGLSCAAKFTSGLDLWGRCAIDLATTGAPYGPGFERYCVNDWQKHTTTIDQFRLTRRHGRDDPSTAKFSPDSWVWRVYTKPGFCVDCRSTRKS